jgi:hypothetical protein
MLVQLKTFASGQKWGDKKLYTCNRVRQAGNYFLTLWQCMLVRSAPMTPESWRGAHTGLRLARRRTAGGAGNWHDSGGRPEQQEGWLGGGGPGATSHNRTK